MSDEQQPPRRTNTGDIIDATSQGIATVARFNPQQVVTVISFIGMTFICSMLAFQAYSERDERKEERRERQEAESSRLRDSNARDELTRQQHNMQMEAIRSHCAGENDKTRRDGAEQVNKILTAFLSEGERARTFQSQENDKFRKEVLLALKANPIGP